MILEAYLPLLEIDIMVDSTLKPIDIIIFDRYYTFESTPTPYPGGTTE